MTCTHRIKMGDSEQWHYISQQCRDRVSGEGGRGWGWGEGGKGKEGAGMSGEGGRRRRSGGGEGERMRRVGTYIEGCNIER